MKRKVNLVLLAIIFIFGTVRCSSSQAFEETQENIDIIFENNIETNTSPIEREEEHVSEIIYTFPIQGKKLKIQYLKQNNDQNIISEVITNCEYDGVELNQNENHIMSVEQKNDKSGSIYIYFQDINMDNYKDMIIQCRNLYLEKDVILGYLWDNDKLKYGDSAYMNINPKIDGDIDIQTKEKYISVSIAGNIGEEIQYLKLNKENAMPMTTKVLYMSTESTEYGITAWREVTIYDSDGEEVLSDFLDSTEYESLEEQNKINSKLIEECAKYNIDL